MEPSRPTQHGIRGKEGNEVGKGIREDVEMRENGEGIRVLGEVDHNSMSLQ